MPNDQVVKIVDNRLVLNVEPVRKYPVLSPGKRITLYVEGQPQMEPVIISNAYMEAVGSILVAGNIISSKIIAGGACAYQQALEKGLRTIHDILSEVVESTSGLKKEELFRNLSEREVIYGLLETKYKNASEIISELLAYQKQLEADVQLSHLISVLNELKIFIEETKHSIDLKQLGVLTRKVGRLSNFYSKIDNSEASIYANYIQNSFIKTTGDIIVKGKGAYNSILEAGGMVKITGLPGVFRGGGGSDQSRQRGCRSGAGHYRREPR